jgi:hypothetical protein
MAHYRRNRFAWLFYTLLFTLALHPILEVVLPGVDPMEWLLALNLAAAVVGVEMDRRMRPLLWLAGAFVAVRMAVPFFGDARFLSLAQVLWSIACLFAAAMTVRHALRGRGVDSERIFAALDAYLLAALAFSVGYWVLERELPGSFGPAPLDLTPQLSIYLSLATLSTLGPANISPETGPARGLMTFEALGGQIYLAVLIARLVGLYATPTPHQSEAE